jgi:hypothetical protein
LAARRQPAELSVPPAYAPSAVCWACFGLS